MGVNQPQLHSAALPLSQDSRNPSQNHLQTTRPASDCHRGDRLPESSGDCFSGRVSQIVAAPGRQTDHRAVGLEGAWGGERGAQGSQRNGGVQQKQCIFHLCLDVHLGSVPLAALPLPLQTLRGITQRAHGSRPGLRLHLDRRSGFFGRQAQSPSMEP